jgi:hypothetical protein
MTAGRLTDWEEPAAQQGEERTGRDRRASDRRAPRRSFDPLFAATLVNHVAPPATEYSKGYPRNKAPRGILVNRNV